MLELRLRLLITQTKFLLTPKVILEVRTTSRNNCEIACEDHDRCIGIVYINGGNFGTTSALEPGHCALLRQCLPIDRTDKPGSRDFNFKFLGASTRIKWPTFEPKEVHGSRMPVGHPTSYGITPILISLHRPQNARRCVKMQEGNCLC